MAIAQAMCNSFKKELMLGTHNFATNGNAFKLALYAEGGGGKSSTTATLGFGTTAYTTTGEVANSGSYTAGGGALTKVAPSVATSTSTATAFTDFADISFTTATITAMGALIYNDTTPIEEIDKKNLLEYQLSKLTSPTTNNPVYLQSIDNPLGDWSVKIFPSTITSNISCTYVRKPITAVWGYTNVTGNALYNPGTSQNYELHDSEETNLVLKILLYAGVSIKDPNIAQLADAKETKKITQEKS